MAHDARLGLATVPSAAGITPSYLDAQQWVKAIAAAKTTIGNLLGGEGRYAGGAEDAGDLPESGAQYPAVTLLVYDDSGYAWPVVTAAATAISFSAADIAEASLYAVVKQLAGVSPAAAVGGLADVVFQAQATAAAAPAHSLLLGTGVVAGSEFTDYLASPAATVTAGAGLFARLDLAEVVTGLWRFGVNTLRVGDGADATIALLAHNADSNKPGLRYSAGADVWESSNDGLTWAALVQGNDARLSDARTPTAHKTSHQHGGSDEVATATPAANAIPKADAAGKLDGWVSDASITVKGKVELATDGESGAGVVVQGNDGRLSNARTPTAHKTSHAVGGADALSAADLGLGTVRGTYTRTAAQTIAHATYTYLEWQARGDHAGLTWSAGSNPSQIVLGAGEGGQYLIIVVVSFGADADGVRRASLVLNSTVATSSTMPPHATGGMTTDLPLTWQGALAAGDMMRVQLYHTAGANLDISHPGTSLRVFRLWG